MYRFILFIFILTSPMGEIFSQEIVHHAGINENLMDISFRYYGTRKCWKEILARNGQLFSDSDLKVWQKIVVPSPLKCTKSLVKTFDKEILKKASYTENFSSIITEPMPLPGTQPPSLPSVTMRPKKSETLNEAPSPLLKNPNDDDNKKLKIKISLSPFVIKLINSEKDINYGGSLEYLNNKQEVFFEYDRSIFSSTDSLTQLNIKSGSQHALLTYDFNKFWGNFTYFALASYDNAREGDIFLTEDQVQFGVIGIKYYFIKYKNNIDDLSLSYIPLFEYIVENVSDDPTSLTNATYHRVISKNIRQSMRLRFKAVYLDKSLKVKNTIFYRPAYSIDQSKFNWSDSLFEQTLELSFKLNEVLDLRYKNTVSWDQRAKVVHLLPSTNVIHRLSLDFHKEF